ncbi:MAG: YbdK family carboxylate-amine ligase [Chitinophagia bacterium]|nr:YbdK family carboxylate-amine ligase [Chitinophagia bacterium]
MRDLRRRLVGFHVQELTEPGASFPKTLKRPVLGAAFSVQIENSVEACEVVQTMGHADAREGAPFGKKKLVSDPIFGLHVHVGMPSNEMAIHIANSARYFLPHVFALSTNSPFWEGRSTGFKSYRTKVFDKFPRTGIPDYFDSYDAYENYVNLLIKTHCIDNAKKIWWDLRVHPFYGTVEFRVCDVPMTIDESIAIAALFQCICAKLFKLRSNNLNFMIYPRALVMENKWRASRYGIDGKLIDFGIEEEKPTRVLIHELLDFVDDVADDLGCRHALDIIPRMMDIGTGADRQLKVFQETGDLVKVTDLIRENFLASL